MKVVQQQSVIKICRHVNIDMSVFALFDPSLSRLNSMAAAPLLRRTDSARGELSPLKHFVVAKKKISEVFEQILNYVKETSVFVEGETGFHLLVSSSIVCFIGKTLFEK